MGGSQSGGGGGGGTEGELGAMDRAACLNLNTRSFKHRSPSRIQIIARTQAWSHTRFAPGNPIEVTNATEVSILASKSIDAAIRSTGATSGVAPRMPASRIQIIARRQAWGHTRVAPGNPPIEMTNALVVSSLAPPSTAAAPIAAPPSTDAAISVAPRMPASPPPRARGRRRTGAPRTPAGRADAPNTAGPNRGRGGQVRIILRRKLTWIWLEKKTKCLLNKHRQLGARAGVPVGAFTKR